jgi:DNA-binding NtrC family response regulator
LPINRYKETDHFRKDLFYRISGITLRVPPLRERPNDLRSLMAAEIAAASAALGRPIVGLSRSAADRLLGYEWPGNLRELKRVIHTAVAITQGQVIEESALLLETPEESEPSPGPGIPGSVMFGRGSDPDLSLRTAERRHIRAVLARLGGNKRRAARALGLARSTLDRKLGEA